MKLLSKKDLAYALITGLTTGILAWLILRYLGKPTSGWLIVIFPVLWILGVQLGYTLGRWIKFFDQFGKFAAIGFTNFAVDTGILNLLIYLTHISTGAGYAVFKVISFAVAVLHSYFWNKAWTFERSGSFAKFILVMLASLVVNVAAASLVVNVIPHGDASPQLWANVGAIVGSATALIFSFIGFRLIVFRESKTQIQ